MRTRPDLLDAQSPDGIEVVQLTADDVPCSHVYMEAQVSTPDSTRLVLHRSAHAHGSDPHDPEHRYLVCDVAGDCALTPITHELGATAPSVSPDGTTLYYFVNETETNGGRLTLKRVGLDGSDRDTVLVLDSPLPGTTFRPSRIYPLSTISSDGKRLALSAFLGDGQTDEAPFGLMVFDLEEPSVRLILQGPTWCNIHPQYCRSTDPAAAHDILVQENHGNRADAQGKIRTLVGGAGADIHVIRDDGSDFRNMPWGRDGNERCQGHQCWAGRSTQAITSTGTREPRENQLIEGTAAPHAGHVGIATPGGVRNDLSRTFPTPMFCHFGNDIAARRIVSDAAARGGGASLPVAGKLGTGVPPAAAEGGWHIYLGDLPVESGGPADNWRYLLDPRSAREKTTHPHPFLSPDGSMAFFNSNESGSLQAYMIRGLDTLA